MEEQIKDIERPKRVPRRYIVELVQDGSITYHPSYREACVVAGLTGDGRRIHDIMNRFKHQQPNWRKKGLRVDVENIAPFKIRRIQFREV